MNIKQLVDDLEDNLAAIQLLYEPSLAVTDQEARRVLARVCWHLGTRMGELLNMMSVEALKIEVNLRLQRREADRARDALSRMQYPDRTGE